VFLFLFFFAASSLAVFAASVVVVAFDLDCFTVVALVRHPSLVALVASGQSAMLSPTFGSLSSSAPTDKFDK
jgi:hypothetical protein